MDWLETLRGFLGELAETGWRGLVVLHVDDMAGTVEELAGLLSSRGQCLLVALAVLRAKLGPREGEDCQVIGPPDVGRVLGREYGDAVIALEGLLRPNIVAGVAETVRAGGALVLVLPPLASWNPGPPGGTGLYREYLLRSFSEARSILWLDTVNNRVLAHRVPGGKPGPVKPQKPPPTRHGVPRVLREKTATRSQALGLEAFASMLRGKTRSLLVYGNRGRGKSYLLGLGLALAVHWHAVGRAEVVAPSLEQAESTARGLLEGLRLLGHREHRIREHKGLVLRVTGPWYRIRFSDPEGAEPAPLLVVDEAARIGIARTRRLSWRSGRIVVSTTIHGYEGSGRAVAHLLVDQLPKPLSRVWLEEPVRYHPGDPLEEWLYRVFLLDVEPPETSAEPGEVVVKPIDRAEMARSTQLLRRVAGVLALAHYRNEPDDILVLLEAKNHSVYAALARGREVVGVVDAAWEEPGSPREERLGLTLLSVHGGPGAQELRGARVVRIAVLPGLQRRGIGTALLRRVEAEARERGVDVATAVFSRHDVIGFWAANGYRAVYISPRYNRVTGEKNIAFAKPLTARAERVVERASSSLRLRLLLSGQSIYRDLAAEKIPLILSATHPAEPRLGLTVEQEERLQLFLRGLVDYEQASDPVFLETARCLSGSTPDELGLTWRETVALVARVVQGKPLNEVASILGVGLEEAWRLSVEAARKAIRSCRAKAG